MSAQIREVITICFHASALPGCLTLARRSPGPLTGTLQPPLPPYPQTSQLPAALHWSKAPGLITACGASLTPENDIQSLPQPTPTYPLSSLSHIFKKYLLSTCTENWEEVASD